MINLLCRHKSGAHYAVLLPFLLLFRMQFSSVIYWGIYRTVYQVKLRLNVASVVNIRQRILNNPLIIINNMTSSVMSWVVLKWLHIENAHVLGCHLQYLKSFFSPCVLLTLVLFVICIFVWFCFSFFPFKCIFFLFFWL